MSRPKTIVGIVLDRSGSMESVKQQTINNYNEQVQQMRENSKDQDIFCSLVTFTGEVYEHCWCVPAEQLQELSATTYRPTGSTAMRDAMGYTIGKFKDTVEVDENTAFLLIVISDGDENSSKHITSAQLKSLVAECEATGKWTISYVGCSKESVMKVVQETGIPIANTAVMNFNSGETAQIGYSNIQLRNSAYYEGRTKGVSSSRNLFSCDSNEIADFTVSDQGNLGPIPNSINVGGGFPSGNPSSGLQTGLPLGSFLNQIASTPVSITNNSFDDCFSQGIAPVVWKANSKQA